MGSAESITPQQQNKEKSVEQKKVESNVTDTPNITKIQKILGPISAKSPGLDSGSPSVGRPAKWSRFR